jgi:branched-chain amino acid transport system substrate-binding protein
VIDDASATVKGWRTPRGGGQGGGRGGQTRHTTDKAVDFNALLTSIKRSNPMPFFEATTHRPADGQANEVTGDEYSLWAVNDEPAGFIRVGGYAAEENITSTPGAALESRPGGGKAFAAKYRRVTTGHRLVARLISTTSHGDRGGDEGDNSTDPAKYLPALARSNTRFTGDISSIRMAT